MLLDFHWFFNCLIWPVQLQASGNCTGPIGQFWSYIAKLSYKYSLLRTNHTQGFCYWHNCNYNSYCFEWILFRYNECPLPHLEKVSYLIWLTLKYTIVSFGSDREVWIQQQRNRSFYPGTNPSTPSSCRALFWWVFINMKQLCENPTNSHLLELKTGLVSQRINNYIIILILQVLKNHTHIILM